MLRHGIRFASVLSLALLTVLLPGAAFAQESGTTSPTDALNSEITALRRSGDYAEALERARRLLELQEGSEDTPAWNLVNSRLLVGDLEHFVALPANEQKELAAADSLAGVAEAALMSGQLDPAEEALNTQLEIRRRLLSEDRRDLIETLAWLGYCRMMRGDLPGAEPLFRESLALSRRLEGDEHPDVASNLLNLGFILNSLGRYEEAAELSREALSLCRTLYGDRHPDTAWAMNNLGTDLHMLGDLVAAEPLYHKALAVMTELQGETNPELGQIMNNLGQIHMNQGDLKQAEEMLRRALRLYETVIGADRPEIALSLANLASVLHYQKRYDEAEEYYRRALAMKRRLFGDEHPNTALSLMNYGDLLFDTGRYAEADSLYGQALATQRKMLGPDHPNIAKSLNKRANVRSRTGEIEAAEKLYREALSMNRRLFTRPHPDTVRLLVNLSRVLVRLDRLEEAEELLTEAVDLFEQVRLRAGYGLERSTFLDAPHLELAAVRLQLGRKDGAWEPLGLVQGRYLTDRLLIDEDGELTADESARRRALRDRLATLEAKQQALARVADEERTQEQSAELDELRSAIPDAEAELSAFQEKLALRYPGTEGRLYTPTEVAATLDDVTALVGWLDVPADGGGYRSWAYVIRNPGPVRWRELESGAGIDPFELGQAAIDDILAAGPFAERDEGAARRLWQNRFGPLSTDLTGIENLIVIPSGPLLGVPVEALINDEDGLVGDRYTVSYTPSWNVYAWQAGTRDQTGRPARDRMLLVGDPPFNPAQAEAMRTESQAEVTPGSGRPELTAAMLRDATSGDPEALARLPRLIGSRWEIDHIAQFGSECLRLLGPQASEQELLKLAASGELATYGTIHFATHALVDDDRPERSALVLSQVDLPDPLDSIVQEQRIFDGLLTAGEIANDLHLASDLVVLSACETGLGRRVGAEGYIGLSHAFLQAGSRGLVVSLWKVDDEATALLMGKFHELRCQDATLPTARALQRAKHWLRAYEDESGDRPFAHPYYWSGFVLIGDAS